MGTDENGDLGKPSRPLPGSGPPGDRPVASPSATRSRVRYSPSMAGRAHAHDSPRLRTATVVTLLVGLLVTAVAALIVRAVVHDQERRLLTERTDEVALILTSAISAIPAELTAEGRILKATGESRSAYRQAALRAIAEAPPTTKQLTFAWLRRQPGGAGYVVLAAAGPSLQPGQVVTDARVRTLDRAMHTKQTVATPVIGPQRLLGFALGPKTAPNGTVLYREQRLGPLRPPRQASTQPFSELDVAIYGTPRPVPGQVLTSTTPRLPLGAGAVNKPLAAGASQWLLSVRARAPLVGGIAASAPLVTALAGLVGSLLIALVVETASRRRDAALALYSSEHRVAETLQRSLLPDLPTLPGLDLAARYLASGAGQQVGGDWFDVFPVSGDRVGIAVGDVIGHDLAAATAMAQIRAALRAYALHGDPPSWVISQLGQLVDTFSLTQLVTVVYAVLDPPGADGRRLLRYSNAGHLPPFLRGPDGTVEALSGGGSVVIGAPVSPSHAQAERWLAPGSALVLFTDGLVESPGGSLDDALRRLADTIAAQDGADADTICQRLLAAMPAGELRDDVALLAVCLTPTAADVPVVPPPAGARDLLEDR